MDLILQFIGAILPVILIFAGLVLLKQPGTRMGVVGWLLTVLTGIMLVVMLAL